ncbi:hypothetical protein ES708_31833 [subsurface metagenome]
MLRFFSEVSSEDRQRFFPGIIEPIKTRTEARNKAEEEKLHPDYQTPATLRGFLKEAFTE